jgi:putative ABC transport system permease protein
VGDLNHSGALMRLFQELWQDLRFAWRGLRRAKAFTAAAVLTLATGIAGTSMTFAIVNGVLLRPLPVRDQARLVLAWNELRSTGAAHWPFRVPEVDTVRDSSRLLEAVAGVGYNGAGRLVALENDAATYLNVAPVMGDFFSVLGISPLAGRVLTRTDDVPGAENVLVITHGLWWRRYGGSPDVFGRHLIVGGVLSRSLASCRRTPSTRAASKRGAASLHSLNFRNGSAAAGSSRAVRSHGGLRASA